MTTYSRYPTRVDIERDGQRQNVTMRSAVVVQDGRARVAAFVANSPRKGVEVILDKQGVVEVQAHISRQVAIVFDDGETWWVDRGDGCSCHNELQRWYTRERGRPARSGIA